MLEELEMAGREGEAVDFAMPELGPDEEAGGGRGAQFLTLTEDGSNDWCCLCDAKVEDVGALLLCTGCPSKWQSVRCFDLTNLCVPLEGLSGS